MIGQDAVPAAPARRPHDALPSNSPLLSELKLTVPVGVVELLEVSVTVAVQVDAWFTTTGASQETVVVVAWRAGTTSKVRMVERMIPPPRASIETMDVPTLAEAVAEKETLTAHVGLHGLFVNRAVTPPGRGDVEKVTGTAVPLTRVTSIDADPLVASCTTVKLLGEGVESPKSKSITPIGLHWPKPPALKIAFTSDDESARLKI